MFFTTRLGMGLMDLGVWNLAVLTNSPHGWIPSRALDSHSLAEGFVSDIAISLLIRSAVILTAILKFLLQQFKTFENCNNIICVESNEFGVKSFLQQF